MSIIEKYPDIPSETREQLDFIRNYFGHEVSIVENEEEELDLSASVVDGIPIITRRPQYEPSTTDIIHEIWHLFLKANLKMINYNFCPDLQDEMIGVSGSKAKLVYVFTQLYSAVEHYFFLKRIDPKYNPYFFLESSLEEMLSIKSTSFSMLEIQSYAVDVVQILILKEGLKTGDCDVPLAYLKTICPNAFEIGAKLFKKLAEFAAVEQEPEIMEQLVKILWFHDGDIRRIRKGQEIIFCKNQVNPG
jgi:hypothetical protein